MIVGIVGLGLIGGSFARSLAETGEHTVYGCDINETSYLAAKMVDAVNDRLTDENVGECDFVIVSIYPQAAVDYVNNHKNDFKDGAVVVDCSGVKRVVCDGVSEDANSRFTFIGGHPMAGTQQWGFGSSRASLFKGGSMILTPYDDTPIAVREKAKKFFVDLGFADVVFTTPEEHDRRIAFTSQLPHVISNAYVKSPRALSHRGFSAGSYKDLTRVSKLNVELWSELFLENADFLADEIDLLIDNLSQYSKAVRSGDKEKLEKLLEDGSNSKKVAK